VSELLVPSAIIFGLVVLNGFFVAAEFAIVGAPRAAIEHQASRGSMLARRVARVLEDAARQDRYIATTQVGITVASLGLGMYGEHVMAEWLARRLASYIANPWIGAHVMASVLAVAALTYLHIVLGEMVPKALALQRAERTALYVTPLILVMEAGVYPLVRFLNGVGNGILALIGVRRTQAGTERYHTSEELQFIIEESQQGGLLRGESGKILRELFEFGDLSAGEAMVPRVLVTGIAAGTEPDELRAIVRAHPHTRYPVYTGDLDNIIGSLHIKDVLRHIIANRPVNARDARPLPYVPGPLLLDEVLAAMRPPVADGGGHGPARRHRRPPDDRGPVRRGGRRDRGGTQARTDREARGRPAPGPRHGAADRGRRGARLHAGAREGDDDQRAGAAAARPAGRGGGRRDLPWGPDRGDHCRRTRSARRHRRDAAILTRRATGGGSSGNARAGL
jgi:CBS domain containing-hemolysin-like protein